MGVATGLLAGALGASLVIGLPVAAIALAYAILLTAYSAWLKHVVIVDVLVVAAGFVLRAAAGALAIQVEISGWLLICTILVALFLALGKRRHEYLTMGEQAAEPVQPERTKRASGLPTSAVADATPQW